jgi:hypothetical protein
MRSFKRGIKEILSMYGRRPPHSELGGKQDQPHATSNRLMQ